MFERRVLTREEAAAIMLAYPVDGQYDSTLLTQDSSSSRVRVLDPEAERALKQAVRFHGKATVHKLRNDGWIVLAHRPKRFRTWWQKGSYLAYPKEITSEMAEEIVSICRQKASLSFVSYAYERHVYLSLSAVVMLVGAIVLATLLQPEYMATKILLMMAAVVTTVLYIGYWGKRRELRHTLRALNVELPAEEESFGGYM